MTLTNIQFELLDQLYFTMEYYALCQNLSLTGAELDAELKQLLELRLIHQLIYNEQSKEYDFCEEIDLERLHTSSYVITKQGLIIHNGR